MDCFSGMRGDERGEVGVVGLLDFSFASGGFVGRDIWGFVDDFVDSARCFSTGCLAASDEASAGFADDGVGVSVGGFLEAGGEVAPLRGATGESVGGDVGRCS